MGFRGQECPRQAESRELVLIPTGNRAKLKVPRLRRMVRERIILLRSG